MFAFSWIFDRSIFAYEVLKEILWPKALFTAKKYHTIFSVCEIMRYVIVLKV